jgi:hypothetical protein
MKNNSGESDAKHIEKFVPLGEITVLRACSFLKLDDALVGQDEDILDCFTAHLPA